MTSAQSIRSSEFQARQSAGGHPVVNVGRDERVASKLGGGVLLAAGLFKGGFKGLILAGLGASLLYRGSTGHCSLYDALDINTAGEDEHDGPGVPSKAGVRVEEEITIARSPEDLYNYWRDYANLPRFMSDIASVEGSGARSHWVTKGPLGAQLEWDSELIRDEPGRLIAWQSLEGAQVATAGSVHFEPAGDGRSTVVRINQRFDPPGGKIGVAASALIGHSPAQNTRASLNRLKEIMEAGAPSASKP